MKNKVFKNIIDNAPKEVDSFVERVTELMVNENPYIKNYNLVMGLYSTKSFNNDEIKALQKDIQSLSEENAEIAIRIREIESTCTHTDKGKSYLNFCHFTKSVKVSRCGICSQYIEEDLHDYSKPCAHVHADGRSAIINTGQFAGNIDICEICDKQF